MKVGCVVVGCSDHSSFSVCSDDCRRKERTFLFPIAHCSGLFY